MSKVVIYILDKFVWILIIAILTSQALQIAGIVEGPKDFSLHESQFYSQENNDDNNNNIPQQELHGAGVRVRRQAGDRSPLIDNLFNVPISALNAVNEFIQSARPVIQRLRESAETRSRRSNESKKKLQQLLEAQQQQQQQHQQQRKEKTLKKVPSLASTEEDEDIEEEPLRLHEGPEIQADGSSSRVLLRV